MTIERPETPDRPASDPSLVGTEAPAAPSVVDVREEEAVAGVLRWLLMETDADAAGYLRLGPGGVEQLRVEPRGLEPERVAAIGSLAHEALTLAGREAHATNHAATTRWLGIGGSKVLVLQEVQDVEQAVGALRFARFAIEWLVASRRDAHLSVLEHRVRSVPGVVWAELEEEDPPHVRVMLSDQADREATAQRLQAAAGDVRLSIEEGQVRPKPSQEPRVQLMDLRMAMNSHATAEVRLSWSGRELMGVGRGRASPAGRLYAAALATADAVKPLVETEIDVTGLYETETVQSQQLLVVAMSVAGEHLVGAVRRGPGQDDASGARAVLDALNRRIARLAGRYGQI